jgi:hypothetical protein
MRSRFMSIRPNFDSGRSAIEPVMQFRRGSAHSRPTELRRRILPVIIARHGPCSP